MDTQDKYAASPDASGHARGSNQSGLRAHNERLVLTLVRQNGPMPKAEIARRTGLSAQTVSVIMRALEAEGLLAKGEPMRGKVGQPSVPMGLVPDGAFFFGLKVGRRSLDLVLCDFLGRVVDRVHVTHRFPTPDGVVDFATSSIAALMGNLPKNKRGRVAGLGIAIPFRLWDWAKPLGVGQADMDPWRTRDVVAEIGEKSGLPVFLQNDATSACGAELVFGQSDTPRDFLYFFIGFFIGGGIVLNGSLFSGNTGNAGALGSMPVRVTEGHTEQLIDVASLELLERAVVAGGGSPNMIWEDPETWSVPDELLEAWIEKAAQGLAYATASAASLIDFEVAIIDGWLPGAVRADLVKRTQVEIGRLNLSGINPPQLREGSIGVDARSLGAASLPLSERFLLDTHGHPFKSRP